MKYSLKNLFLAFFYLSFAILTFLSLITFSSNDPSFIKDSSVILMPNNFFGKMGSYFSSILLYVFGCSSFILVLLFILLTTRYLEFISIKWLKTKLISLSLLLLINSAIFYCFDIEWYSNIAPGGLIGRYLFLSLNNIFIYEHSLIFLFVTFWASIVLIFNFSLIRWLYLVISICKVLPIFSILNYCKSILAAVYNKFESKISVLAQAILSPGNNETSNIYQDTFWNEYIQPAQQMTNSELFSSTNTSNTPLISNKNLSDNNITEKDYSLPKLNLLAEDLDSANNLKMEKSAASGRKLLEEKLACFSIHGKVINTICGPVVTLYEYQPSTDTKVSNVIAREDDLAMALQAISLRIIAPIPGRDVIGFEVAWDLRANVLLRTLLNSEKLHKSNYLLPMVLGKDTQGNLTIIDLAAMPHLLVAGSTGSGKSVGLNSMLVTLLSMKTPQEIKLILIDPKRLEFSSYADIAHLMFPIINDPNKAILALKNAINIMQYRYELMAKHQVRNIIQYNQLDVEMLPYIIIVIDELADLMMTAGKEIEQLITRLAQMARAAGIHMIVATQRPSVDVITGLIKVNFPSRISFKVTTKVDSRTILDSIGAEKLLGKGDMLFLDTQGILKRVHGAYVSDREINEIVFQIKSQIDVAYESLEQSIQTNNSSSEDELYPLIIDFVKTKDEISISLVQRVFNIGYNRSARIINQLEADGYIMTSTNSKMRKVIKTPERTT